MNKEKIKIYYKGEFDENIDDIIKDAMGRKSYLLIGSGFNFKTQERDMEFEYEPLPDLNEQDLQLDNLTIRKI